MTSLEKVQRILSRPSRSFPMRHSVAWYVLQAAKSLPGPFDVTDLIVAAWQLDREAMGLRKYKRQYPDSNKISSVIYGQRGLIARGFLLPMLENGIFSLGDAALPQE